jgi:hypothetical protein
MVPTQSFINVELLPFLQLYERLLVIVVYRPQSLLAESDQLGSLPDSPRQFIEWYGFVFNFVNKGS